MDFMSTLRLRFDTRTHTHTHNEMIHCDQIDHLEIRYIDWNGIASTHKRGHFEMYAASLMWAASHNKT